MPQQLLPYWNALKRWWWLILVSVLLAGASAYLYWQRQPPVYQARIALIIGNSARSANPNAQQLGIERTLATFYGEMTKRQPITQAVIQRLGLSMLPEQLSEAIETRVIFDAQILEIYIYDVDPRRAAAIATETANVLIEQSPSSSVGQENQEFVQTQLVDLKEKMNQIDAQLADLHNRITQMTSAADLNEAQATVAELETLKRTYSETYAQYLAVLNNQTVNSLSIVEPATVPTRPVSTDLTTTLLLAIAGGLVLSIGAIILLEYSDDVLHWGDSPFTLGLPVLGVVPIWTDQEHSLILPTQPHSPEADALRSLRARISLGDEDSGIRKLAITSSAPRDGKSFAAINLAVAAAATGLRTILVDGDLRLGNLHTFLGGTSEPGLSDLLRRSHSRVSSENVIQPTPVENLFLIPIGRPVLDPASLLSATKLEALMTALLADADLVVVDTPPVGVGPDAALLAAASDAVVLVANVDRTRRRMAIKAIAQMERYNLLGLIFNRVSLKRSHSQYYHYYHQLAPSDSLVTRMKKIPAALRARLKLPLRPASKRLSVPSSPTPAPDDNSQVLPAQLSAGNGHEPPAFEAAQSQSHLMAERLWEAIETAGQDDTIILTTTEAAERLETTEETVRGWCAAGRLPAVRIGKQWLVTGLILREASSVRIEDDTPGNDKSDMDRV
ncbi:MAG TPA: polysaccharide biosynthesis tyrosine autokinase [Anaerolineae bacterium]|nr:polysaccharide biosynthesis tyrosine autokinase [Anaerolineae bacterium]